MVAFVRIFILAMVCVGPLAAEVAFETVALGVEAGPGVVKEETGRLLARVVFGRLQAALDGRAMKALVVNENLNLGRAVAEEARKLAGGAQVAVLSVEWRNPKFFPAERLKDVSRGIYMAAVTGDLEVEFLPADFLAAKGEDESVADGAKAVGEFLPEAVKRLSLKEPKSGNVLVAVPPNHVSSARAMALAKAAGFPAKLVVAGGGDGLGRATIATDVNGVWKTNAPLGILLKGKFPESGPKDIEAFSMAMQFGENRYAEHYEAIGEVGVRILAQGKKAEIYRLMSENDRMAGSLGRLEDYRILKEGAVSEVGAVLADVLLEDPLSVSGKGCRFDPGLAFRMATTEGSLTTMVCLNCGMIRWVVRDAKGEKLSDGLRDLSRAKALRLAGAGLIGLPGDEALGRLKDR